MDTSKGLASAKR